MGAAQHHCTMNTPGKKKRSYDQKFKKAAVEMYVNGQRSGPAVARDLGICRRTLHLWVRELNPTAKPMPQTPAQLQAQLRSARAELQSLRNQCEILKKRWPFFPLLPALPKSERVARILSAQ